MKKVGLLMALAILLLLPMAAATKPAPAEAAYLFLTPPEAPEVRVAGQNLIITGPELVEFTGTYEGTALYQCKAVVHLRTGEATFKCRAQFDGAVDGTSGSFILEHIGSGMLGPSPAESPVSGQWVAHGATGDLAGYRARGTFDGTLVSGTVIINQHTDP